MRNPTFKEKVARWEILQTNAKPRLGDMPQLTNDLTRLEQLIDGVKDLEARGSQHKATFLETTRTKRDLLQEGDEVYQRLNLALRGQLGPKNEKLHEFGLTPRKASRRKGKTPGNGGEAPPAVGPAVEVGTK